MGKLLFSILFISCLILVSANVIPNHLNNVGLNHNAINLNINAVSAVNEKMLGVNPVESCVKKCKEDGKPGGLCKFNCENRHLRRTNPEKYEDCMKKCSSSAMGEAQSPNVCECRQSCEKSYPKNVFVY